MPKLIATGLLITLVLLPLARPYAEEAATRQACHGVAVSSFEQRLSERVRRYALEPTLLMPFVALWRSGRRPHLPARPERVIIYALPGQPLLIGYQSGTCMIASLSVDREQLWRWLGPRIGWTI